MPATASPPADSEEAEGQAPVGGAAAVTEMPVATPFYLELPPLATAEVSRMGPLGAWGGGADEAGVTRRGQVLSTGWPG